MSMIGFGVAANKSMHCSKFAFSKKPDLIVQTDRDAKKFQELADAKDRLVSFYDELMAD